MNHFDIMTSYFPGHRCIFNNLEWEFCPKEFNISIGLIPCEENEWKLITENLWII